MQPPPAYVIVFLVATMIVVVAVLAMLLIMILMNEKRRRLYEQTLTTLKAEHQAGMLQTQVEIQEQTFTNISREIHDHVQLSLVLAKLNLYNQQEAAAVVDTTHHQTIGLIDEAITNLSDISKSLSADYIRAQGLLAALEKEVGRINRSAGQQLTLTVEGEPVFLPAPVELVLFRITQEAVNNMLKHAAATKAGITLRFTPHNLHLTIQDNGSGFDVNNMHKPKGSGLTNMEARARLFGGELQVQSAPGQGTQLLIILPLNLQS